MVHRGSPHPQPPPSFLELARRGYDVVGVDFSPRLVQAAQTAAQEERLPVEFVEADCRTVNLHREFDAAICVYDVVGTFPEDSDNSAMLLNLRRHIRPDGGLVLSVLNFASLQVSEKNAFDPLEEPGRLQALRASELMQESGQIFDPEFYRVGLKSHVVCRKERFDSPGDQLPTELIVRDRRYTLNEISQACSEAGLRVLAR